MKSTLGMQLSVVATLALLGFTGQALAKPVSPSLCAVTDIVANATLCTGYVQDNDSVADAINAADTFGWNVATLYQYKDNNMGAGSDTFLFDAVQNSNYADQGTLTFLQNLSGPFILTVKGGNDVAYYYFDGTHSFLSGNYLTIDIPGDAGSGNGWSHSSIYTAAPVPEPQTYALMLAGLGLVGFAARRRKAA